RQWLYAVKTKDTVSAELLIQAGIGETRIARIAGGGLEDFVLERGFQTRAGVTGDIIYGRVQKVVAGIGAAFVEIGQARPGFLAAGEAMVLSRGGREDISACVREGEAVLVQAILEPMGEKGARLSAALSLPGRLLVMTPNRRGISLSRRIEGAAREKLLGLSEALQAAHPDAGFILRTEAAEASEDEIMAEAQRLAQSWRDITSARQTTRPPTTLYRELGPIERSLREMARADISHIRIDDAATLDAARDFCRRALPGLQSKLLFAPPPLFDETLEDEISALFQPRVALASGGWITVESTEGLTAIDVNSGSFTHSSGPAQTSLTTNLEAAREIGRQI